MSSYVGHLKRQRQKTLIILDLNGILVLRLHKNQLPLSWTEDDRARFLGDAHALENDFYVWRRPHLESFLEFLFEHFDVATWTSAKSYNARHVVDAAFSKCPHLKEQLIFQWTQENCTSIDIPQMQQQNQHQHKKGGRQQVFLKEALCVWEKFPEYNENKIYKKNYFLKQSV